MADELLRGKADDSDRFARCRALDGRRGLRFGLLPRGATGEDED